jgi:hypothetical protein
LVIPQKFQNLPARRAQNGAQLDLDQRPSDSPTTLAFASLVNLFYEVSEVLSVSFGSLFFGFLLPVACLP